MPARKNRPDKFRGQPKTVAHSPKEEMDLFLQAHPEYLAKRLHGGQIPAWEVMSKNFTLFGGLYATLAWDASQKRWAATHNAVPSPGDFHYRHRTISDALDWYKDMTR